MTRSLTALRTPAALLLLLALLAVRASAYWVPLSLEELFSRSDAAVIAFVDRVEACGERLQVSLVASRTLKGGVVRDEVLTLDAPRTMIADVQPAAFLPEAFHAGEVCLVFLARTPATRSSPKNALEFASLTGGAGFKLAVETDGKFQVDEARARFRHALILADPWRPISELEAAAAGKPATAPPAGGR